MEHSQVCEQSPERENIYIYKIWYNIKIWESTAITVWSKTMKEVPSLIIQCIYINGLCHSITPNNQIRQDAGLLLSSVSTLRIPHIMLLYYLHPLRSSTAVNKTNKQQVRCKDPNQQWIDPTNRYCLCIQSLIYLISLTSTENQCCIQLEETKTQGLKPHEKQRQ